MENNHDNYYYDIDFYQFFKVIGATAGIILVASFIYQIFEK